MRYVYTEKIGKPTNWGLSEQINQWS